MTTQERIATLWDALYSERMSREEWREQDERVARQRAKDERDREPQPQLELQT